MMNMEISTGLRSLGLRPVTRTEEAEPVRSVARETPSRPNRPLAEVKRRTLAMNSERQGREGQRT